MKEIFTDQNLMLAIVGSTSILALASAANVKQITSRPLLALAGGAVLLPVANQFLAPGRKKAAA